MSYTFIFAIYVIIGFGIYVTCVYRAELDNEPLDENACAELASSCIMWPLFLLIIPIILVYMLTLHVSNYVSKLAEKHKELDKEKAREKRNDKMTIEILKDRITKLESQLSDITKKKENI